MRFKFSGLLSLSLLFLFTSSVLANHNIETISVNAVSSNPADSAAAIAELRAMGPAGLAALVQKHRTIIERQIADPTAPSTAEWRRVSAALDAVSQQKDSYLSQLYWYTDIAAAKSAAVSSGKPILSLRLLGKLVDEYSCANSRFFRSILYSNARVSKELQRRFVLHWQTVRAVPRITIDFGDGRKIERTVTGNSIHYVLDTEGKLLDAIPGLYGPPAFLRALDQGELVFKQVNGATTEQRFDVLYKYHRARANAIQVAWYHDTQKIGGTIPEGLKLKEGAEGEALAVMPIAITKAITETSMLRAMIGGAEALGRVTDELAWRKIAALHSSDGELDTASIGLIRRQTQRIFVAGRSSVGPQATFHNLLRNLQASVALDTVRNEYLLRTQLHAWLARDRRVQDVDAFNEKVYAQLFLTPGSDPWLGLLSPEAYTALENGGVK